MEDAEKIPLEVARNVKSEGRKKNYITLSSGVVLEMLRVPNTYLLAIIRRYPDIPIPMFHSEDTGRDEENPGDPVYLARKSQRDTEVAAAMIDIMILIGTKLHSKPEDIPSVMDHAWSKRLNILGYKIGTDPDERYLAWIKYVAGSEDEDIEKITEGVGRSSGVSDKDVDDAVKRFRRTP